MTGLDNLIILSELTEVGSTTVHIDGIIVYWYCDAGGS